jgi:hypothetical protein
MTLGDKYHWIVRYNDGGSLNQIESNGKRNSYQDIDREKLSAFEMWEGSTRILLLKFNKNQQLIWRRRVETSPFGVTEVCHIIGKQENINGENLQGIIGLFESDGRIEITGRFHDDHPWFFPIQIHESEGEKWSQ